MTDKVHPATKPNAAAAAPPPPTKTQLHNPKRHPNRPPPSSKHLRKDVRRYLCLACFWFTLLLLAILILASVAAAAFYVLYQPHYPLFSVTSLKISSFNLTTTPSAYLTTKLNLTLSAKNPNKKIAFLYGPMSITAQYDSVKLSNGSFAKFTNSPDSTFIIHTTMGMNSQVLETESANTLRSDLKKRNGLPMSIVVDTMVGIKIETSKTKKIGIRVKCVGIRGVVPKVNSTAANVSKAKCMVGLRVKIFEWTF
ncbi:NDR1/HIN1-like protein 13 [Primulina eburnea]|uniref:NDR1/HIN1-like protein 13 n=1 Tax=Primulina eburnea TaxID=1245227 RepID=UPI003C6CB2C1